MARVKRGVQANRRHKKVLARAKVITVRAHACIAWQCKRLPKQVNTPIVTAATKNALSAAYGSRGSMQARV